MAREQRTATGSGGNIVSLGLTQGVMFLSGFAVEILLANYLGVASFGIFATVMGIVGVFGFLGHLGLGPLIARRVARDPSSSGDTLRQALAAVSLMSVAMFALVTTTAWIVDGRALVVSMAAIAGLTMSLNGLVAIFRFTLQGLRVVRREIKVFVLGRVVLVLGIVAALYSTRQLEGVFLARLVASSLTALLLFVVVSRAVSSPWSRPRLAELRTLARAAAPFAVITLFADIYIKVDVIMLARICGDEEVGLYRVAAMFIMQLPVLAGLLNKAFYPRVSVLKGDVDSARSELEFQTRLMLLLGLPIAVGGLLVHEELLVFLFRDYESATLAFAIMLPTLPLRLLKSSYATDLAALDLERRRAAGLVVAAAFNVSTNLYAIPRWGAVGAAATTLLTEILLLVWFGVFLTRRTRGLPLGRPLLAAVPPTVFLGLLVWALPGHVALRVGVGALAYLGVSYLLRSWNLQDIRRLRRL